MNRVGGDYLEGLCYKSFISIDERTTVNHLSQMLSIEITEISKVLSLFIRLGLAEKVVSENDENLIDNDVQKRIAAIYDCNLPASLMLGNLGSTVKSFAVTLYEVGKLLDKTVTEFVQALQSIDDPGDDSMVNCFEKCQIISKFALFLKSQEIAPGGVDMLQLDSLLSLDSQSRSRMIEKNYSALIVMAPLSLNYLFLEQSQPVHFGPPSKQFHSPWLLLYIHAKNSGPPVFVWPQGDIVTFLPEEFYYYETVRLYKWGFEPTVVPTTTLLISLNDSLPSSPVLIQCYEKENEKMIDLGFPNSDLKGTSFEAAFGLDSMFGFIRYVIHEDGEKKPIDIDYGIPTNSLDLCDEVLRTIDDLELLKEPNLTKTQESTKRISADLAHFIDEWSCNVGHPIRPIKAANGELNWY